jgi:hypothetical protein
MTDKKRSVKDDLDADPVVKEAEKQLNQQMKQPFNALDSEWLQVEPAYGKEAPSEFYDRLVSLKGKAQPLYNEDGKPQLDEHGRQKYAVEMSHLWDELGFFTRDLRLGNLNRMGSDVAICEHYLALAGDCLSMGLTNSFTSAYRRVAGKLELSQSRGGFFRKNRNTARVERTNTENAASGKGLFGGQRDD